MDVLDVNDMVYDGSQLHHAFAYEQGAMLGPSICYFIGPAEVKTHLVDLEDSLHDDFIKSESMIHFIIEIPSIGIQEAVVWQRLFMRMIATHLNTFAYRGSPNGSFHIRVDGDDLFGGERKLSVSIATLSMFGGMIHAGVNIVVGEGCPVAAIGLADILKYDTPKWNEFADHIAHQFAEEYNDIVRASYKVIAVP